MCSWEGAECWLLAPAPGTLLCCLGQGRGCACCRACSQHSAVPWQSVAQCWHRAWTWVSLSSTFCRKHGRFFKKTRLCDVQERDWAATTSGIHSVSAGWLGGVISLLLAFTCCACLCVPLGLPLALQIPRATAHGASQSSSPQLLLRCQLQK